MTTFQRETFDEAYPDAGPLLLKHWAEISSNPDELEVDTEAYRQCEKLGMLRVYTARNEGLLVGYTAMFVHKGLHYRQSVQAIQDVFYVDPSRRGRMLGKILLNFADNQLFNEGVSIIYRSNKVQHPTLGKLLAHEGYASIENVYQRRVTQND